MPPPMTRRIRCSGEAVIALDPCAFRNGITGLQRASGYHFRRTRSSAFSNVNVSAQLRAN
jgi:hypothetical protein